MRVIHIGVIGQHEPPAVFPGADAEIVFLAITGAKRFLVEQADGVAQFPPDHQAKAVEEGDGKPLAGGRAGGDAGHGGHVDAFRQRVFRPVAVFLNEGDGLPGRGIGQRPDQANPWIAAAQSGHAVEPALADHRIAVEQHGPGSEGSAESGVGGEGIAFGLLVTEQGGAMRVRETVQHLRRFRAASIIDDDQAPGRHGTGEQGSEAAAYVVEGIMHANDDIHGHGPRGGWRHHAHGIRDRLGRAWRYPCRGRAQKFVHARPCFRFPARQPPGGAERPFDQRQDACHGQRFTPQEPHEDARGTCHASCDALGQGSEDQARPPLNAAHHAPVTLFLPPMGLAVIHREPVS